ncbi:PLD nuclease N-terminal domain-containing protein [Bacillaceae bacterium W0354]
MNVMELIKMLLPLIILQFILIVVALIDLARIEETKGPKWVWAIVIVLGNLIGPIIYFIFGRRQ